MNCNCACCKEIKDIALRIHEVMTKKGCGATGLSNFFTQATLDGIDNDIFGKFFKTVVTVKDHAVTFAHYGTYIVNVPSGNGDEPRPCSRFMSLLAMWYEHHSGPCDEFFPFETDIAQINMDAICTAHKQIQRKRPISPEIAAKLARADLSCMLTEPREEILAVMRTLVCGDMLRGPAEFIDQLNKENPIIDNGNFATKAIVWYLAEWESHEVLEIVVMIAHDTKVRNIAGHTKKIIKHAREYPAVWPMLNVIVKRDMNHALVFSYRERAPVTSIKTAEDLQMAISVAVAYLIHSIVARPCYTDPLESPYNRAFDLFRTLARRLSAL